MTMASEARGVLLSKCPIYSCIMMSRKSDEVCMNRWMRGRLGHHFCLMLRREACFLPRQRSLGQSSVTSAAALLLAALDKR